MAEATPYDVTSRILRCWVCGTEIMTEDPNPDTDPLSKEAQRRGNQAWTDWSEEDIASMDFQVPWTWAFFFTTCKFTDSIYYFSYINT